MTDAEFFLSLALYFIMSGIVYKKQSKAMQKEYDNPIIAASFCAIFWPITLVVYIIRATFFEDWI